jgi:BolA protein
MTIAQSIEQKLTAHFAPTFLRVINDSTKHAGHMPEDVDESHLGIVVVSEKFAGLNRVARSRAVHTVIAEEIAKIHALTVLKTLTAEEFAQASKL